MEDKVSAAPEVMATDIDESERKDTSELDKYWSAVRTDPSDFTGWTYLLQYVEQENLLDAARQAYDTFLQRYPYCYGYWKKYADLEKQNENVDCALQVFDRGAQAVPLSIDLWLHYVNFVITQNRTDVEQEEVDSTVEALFERAIAAAGLEFRSDRLWDSYINWLRERGTPKKIVSVQDRVLKIPTQHYKRHFEEFCELVPKYHPKDLLSSEEFTALCSEITSKSKSPLTVAGLTDDDATEVSQAETAVDEPPPGVDEPPSANGGCLSAVDSNKEAELSEEDLSVIVQKVIDIRRAWHQATEEEVVKRWNYEEAIRRPYFHVKPLERSQLKNWKEYVDFEIASGSYERTVILFERCLIACTLYEEFWLKYARYLETHDVDKARSVFRRACMTHLPLKSSLHMSWAAFEERHGCPDAAIEALNHLEKNKPGLAVVALRRISIERRRGNKDAIEQLYKQYIAEAKNAELRNFYSSKFARYQAKVLGNLENAKEILEAALEKDNTNGKLYLQLLDLEYQRVPIDEEAMVAIFDRAINSDLKLEQRVSFCQRKVEFLGDFGTNIERNEDVNEQYQKLLKELQAVKKHRISAEPGAAEEGNSAKRQKTDNSVSYQHSVNGDSMGAMPVHPNQMVQPGPLDASMPAYNSYGYTPTWPGYTGSMYDYRQSPWTYPPQYYGPPMH